MFCVFGVYSLIKIGHVVCIVPRLFLASIKVRGSGGSVGGVFGVGGDGVVGASGAMGVM